MLGCDFELAGNVRAGQCVHVGLAGAPVGHCEITAQPRGDEYAAHSRHAPQRFE